MSTTTTTSSTLKLAEKVRTEYLFIETMRIPVDWFVYEAGLRTAYNIACRTLTLSGAAHVFYDDYGPFLTLVVQQDDYCKRVFPWGGGDRAGDQKEVYLARCLKKVYSIVKDRRLAEGKLRLAYTALRVLTPEEVEFVLAAKSETELKINFTKPSHQTNNTGIAVPITETVTGPATEVLKKGVRFTT